MVPGEPLRRGVKRKRGSRISRFWTYRRLHLGNGGGKLVLITNRNFANELSIGTKLDDLEWPWTV